MKICRQHGDYLQMQDCQHLNNYVKQETSQKHVFYTTFDALFIVQIVAIR